MAPTPQHTFEPVELPSAYAKAVVAILAAVAGVLAAALTDDVVTQLELANIGVALLTAVGVYLVPNLDKSVGHWLKAIVAVLGTALQALVPFLAEGRITTSGWILVFVAALGAVGVGIVPNTRPAVAVVDTTPPPEGYVPRHVAD